LLYLFFLLFWYKKWKNSFFRMYIGFDFKLLLTIHWSTVTYCTDARKKIHYRTRKVQLITGNYLTNALWKAVFASPLVPTYFYATMHVYQNLLFAQYFQINLLYRNKTLFSYYNSQCKKIRKFVINFTIILWYNHNFIVVYFNLNSNCV